MINWLLGFLSGVLLLGTYVADEKVFGVVTLVIVVLFTIHYNKRKTKGKSKRIKETFSFPL